MILLTTTALLLLVVFQQLQLSISGSYGVEYYDEENTGGSADSADVSGNDFLDDGLIVFSGSSTADNGLTFGARMTLNHAGAIEDQQLTIDGDFGHFMAGAQDGVVDGMDSFMTPGSAIIENGATTTNGDTVGLLGSSMVAETPPTAKSRFQNQRN